MDVFDIYFSSLVAFTLHPGYEREGTERPTIKQCAELAQQMLEEREQWLLSQQQSSEEPPQ